MVAQIFAELGTIATLIINLMGSVFEGTAGLFYDSVGGSLTLLGSLSLIGVGFGAFTFVLNWVKGLINLRMSRR